MLMSRAMSSTNDRKVVQTKLNEREYERFKRIAADENKSLKEALREAAERYVESREQLDPDDPLFTFHDRVTVCDGERTDAGEFDSYVYE